MAAPNRMRRPNIAARSSSAARSRARAMADAIRSAIRTRVSRSEASSWRDTSLSTLSTPMITSPDHNGTLTSLRTAGSAAA